MLGSWALTLLSPPGHSVLPECGLCPDPWPFAVGPRLSAKEEVLGVWDRTRRTTLGRQTPPRPCGSQKESSLPHLGHRDAAGTQPWDPQGGPLPCSAWVREGALTAWTPGCQLLSSRPQMRLSFYGCWKEQALRAKGCDLNPALGLCYQNACVVSRKSQLLRLHWFPHLQRAEEDPPHRTTVWPERYLCVQAAGT